MLPVSGSLDAKMLTFIGWKAKHWPLQNAIIVRLIHFVAKVKSIFLWTSNPSFCSSDWIANGCSTNTQNQRRKKTVSRFVYKVELLETNLSSMRDDRKFFKHKIGIFRIFWKSEFSIYWNEHMFRINRSNLLPTTEQQPIAFLDKRKL